MSDYRYISRKREPKVRLSVWIPQKFYDRLDADSKKYGITKTAMIHNMILDYYRAVDASFSMANNKAAVCQAAREPQAPDAP